MESTQLEQCLEKIQSLSAMSFRFRPKDDLPVDLLGEAMRLARELSLDELEQLRSGIERKSALKLMYLSVLAAERAMNRRDQDWLKTALMVHVVEGFAVDYRENYLRLYAIEYAAWRGGCDLRQALADLDPLMDDVVRKRLGEIFEVLYGENALKMADLDVTAMPDGELRFVAHSAA